MALKDILVHLDSDKTNTARMNAALELASAFDAHITGLYVIPQIAIPTYAEVHIPADIIEAQEREARERATKVEAAFTTAAKQTGCAFEWRCVKGDVAWQINAHARYVDLIMLGQAEEGGLLSVEAAAVDDIVLGAARPVLFIPYIGARGVIGKRVLVAWNGTREAVRAVNDALPILERADQVEVIAVNPKAGEGDIPTADICLHLARHGVKAQATQAVAADVSVGDLLLSRAADRGIDMLVTGAYGHTRLRETVLGGVTRHLLRHMTVPVLMSH